MLDFAVMTRPFSWVLLLLVALPASEAGHAQAQDLVPEQPRAMLVFDASARMLEPFGPGTKQQAASGAVAGVIKRYVGQLQLGLAAFGHRNTAACSDFEIVQPVGAIVPQKLNQSIARFKPRGAAAIAQMLDLAARTVAPAGLGGDIVLVSGGADTCQADPCTIAKLLGEAGKIHVHVIALAGGQGAVTRQLKCVADRTGGGYWRVKSEAELAEALNDAFAAVVRGESVSPPVTVEAGQQAGVETNATGSDAAAQTEQELTALTPDASFNPEGKPIVPVSMTALLTDAGPPINTGLVWRVYQLAPDAKAEPKLVISYKDAAPVAQLIAGDFLVNVSYGKANITRKITVAEGAPSSELFVLNAGGLKIIAQGPGGDPLPPEVISNDVLSSEERDPLGNGTKVAAGIRPGLTLRLNSGLYHLVSTYGDANAVVHADVSVEAGKITEVVIGNGGAKVTFKLVSEPGGEALAGTRWRIFDSDGTLVKESVGALPTHVLAPGKYTVEAERAGQVFADQITLEPGVARQIEVLAKE